MWVYMGELNSLSSKKSKTFFSKWIRHEIYWYWGGLKISVGLKLPPNEPFPSTVCFDGLSLSLDSCSLVWLAYKAGKDTLGEICTCKWLIAQPLMSVVIIPQCCVSLWYVILSKANQSFCFMERLVHNTWPKATDILLIYKSHSLPYQYLRALAIVP